MRLPPLLLALATLLAGCFAPAAPAAEPAEEPAPVPEAIEGPPPAVPRPAHRLHSIREVVPIEVERPGATLRGHVYLPDADGPVGVVLGFGPYWGDLFPATGNMSHETDGRVTMKPVLGDTVYGNLTDAGFAVALLNVRGTAASGGCYRFFDVADGADAAAIVAALASAPWSNGRVGMYGVSYDGWTQYAALAHAPPALRAIVPVSGIVDPWSIQTRHGAPVAAYAPAAAGYTLASALGAYSLTLAFRPAAPSPDAGRLCADGAHDARAASAAAVDGDRTEWFRAHDLRGAVAASGVPALATYGIGDREGLVLQVDGLFDLLAPGSRLLVGHWPHGPPTREQPGFPDMVVSWFDAHLRDGEALVAPGVDYQDTDGAWRQAPRWPPAATATTLHLAGEALATSAPASAAPRAFASSDRPPGLSDCGPDKAVWVSPPLSRDAHLAGNFRVNLTLASTAPDGNVAAFLFRLAGDGCPGEAVEVGRALTDLRHRGHLEVGEPFPVGDAAGVSVASHPFAATARAGERLALVLAGGGGELLPKAAKPALLVHAGTLALPVVGAPLEFQGTEAGTDVLKWGFSTAPKG